MFKLVTACERVVIEPALFGRARRAAYAHALNKHYAGRVVRGCGLVIGVWDVMRVGAETLQPSCGRAAADVHYRLVVFAPFRGEAIYATIGLACPQALLLTLGFFGYVRIPPDAVPPGTSWDADEKVWIYRLKGNDISNYLDVSVDVVARVTNVHYAPPRTTPPVPLGQVDPDDTKQQPMRITATLHDPNAGEDSPGLGDPLWWLDDPEEEYDEGDEAAMGDEEGEEEEGE